MKKVIKGIGLLDLTSATKESLNGLNLIKGVGCVLMGENNKKILEGVELKGVGTTITVPNMSKEAVVVKTGTGRFDANFFESATEPLTLVLVGVGIFESDVTIEMVQEKLASIYGAGVLACSEQVAGAINAKSTGHTGIFATYKEGAEVSMSDLELTNEYLRALKDNTVLVSVGDINMLGDIDEELFKKKIESIQYIGDILANERYRGLLSVAKGEGDLRYIPDGYVYHGSRADLSAAQAQMMEGESWYVDKALHIKADVTEEMLKKSLKSMHCGSVICHKTMIGAVKALLDNQAKILPYTHKVRVYDSHVITAAQLQYEKEPVLIVNQNSVVFDKDVTAELIEEKIEYIDNMNSIVCEAEIYPAVMDKIRESKGQVHPKREQSSDETVIAKGMGYLKL